MQTEVKVGGSEMRLIDADKFKQQIAAVCVENHYDTGRANSLIKLIDAQPTAYDVEKVIKLLDNRAASAKEYWDAFNDSCAFGEMNAYEQAIEIVRSGGCKRRADDE